MKIVQLTLIWLAISYGLAEPSTTNSDYNTFGTIMVFETNEIPSKIAYKLLSTSDNPVEVTDSAEGGSSPDVAYMSSSSWVIVYETDGTIYAQIFANSGSTRYSAIQVTPSDGVTYLYPSVAMIDDVAPEIVIVYQGNDDIYMTILSTSGVTLLSNNLVNTEHSTGTQRYPQVASNYLDDDFMVVWESQGQDGDGWGVYGKIYYSENDYEVHASTFQISSESSGDQYSVDIAGASQEYRFAIVWRDDVPNIYCSVYDYNGNNIFEVQVNTDPISSDSSLYPVVKWDADGYIFISWEEENGSNDEIFMKTLADSTGTTQTEQTNIVTTEVENLQLILRSNGLNLIAYENGDVMILYQDDSSYDSDFSMNLRDDPPAETPINFQNPDEEEEDSTEEEDGGTDDTDNFSTSVDVEPPIGAIVGGAVGFMVFMVVIIIVSVFIKKQQIARRQQAQRQRIANMNASKSNDDDNKKSSTPANDTPFQASNNNNTWNQQAQYNYGDQSQQQFYQQQPYGQQQWQQWQQQQPQGYNWSMDPNQQYQQQWNGGSWGNQQYDPNMYNQQQYSGAQAQGQAININLQQQ